MVEANKPRPCVVYKAGDTFTIQKDLRDETFDLYIESVIARMIYTQACHKTKLFLVENQDINLKRYDFSIDTETMKIEILGLKANETNP